MPIVPWLVFWLFGAGAFLVVVGVELALTPPSHTWKLAVFAILCLAICHSVYWLCRDKVTDSAIKAVDYLYLGLGFLALLNVLEIQAVLLEQKVPSIRAAHKIDYVKYEKCDPAKIQAFQFSGQVCGAVASAVSLLKGPYDHAELRRFLDYASLGFTFFGHSLNDYRPLYEQMAWLYKDMNDQVYGYVDSQVVSAQRKLMALYILCVALSIRIGRVSAELFMRPNRHQTNLSDR
jgi:hypothetical protein